MIWVAMGRCGVDCIRHGRNVTMREATLALGSVK
jgi:hypothetical protein